MRTTLDIPESLLSEGLRITKLKTETELVKTALDTLIRKHKIAGIKKYKGKLDLGIRLDVTRDRK